MSRTARKEKYYVVWRGRRTGIFDTWEECSAQVKGFTRARYKAFNNLAEARQAFQEGAGRISDVPAPVGKQVNRVEPPISPSTCVDAACSGSPGPMEFRGVSTGTGEVIFHEGPFEHGTNNVGEFLAIVQALKWLKRRRLAEPVYSDSQTAIQWVRRKVCNTSLVPDKENAKLFRLIAQAEEWLRTHKVSSRILKWDTQAWGEIPADFNRK